MFVKNFGDVKGHTYVLEDLGALEYSQLPETVDIAWASFPCTDLSSAGGRAGLHKGPASSVFWHFVKVLARMGSNRPPLVVLENVTAFGTRRSGEELVSAVRALNGLGYSVDLLSIDAASFVPQSRPRLFVVGVKGDVGDGDRTVSKVRPAWSSRIFLDQSLRTHQFTIPPLPARSLGLGAFVQEEPEDPESWWPHERVRAYVHSLSSLQLERHENLRTDSRTHLRTAFRRMRGGVPRWEMRADGLAGCLRTSSGGSSKQAILVIGRGRVKIRWMSPREYAGLMGVADYNLIDVFDHHAYSGFGDGVCAPVVTWLMKHYALPVMSIIQGPRNVSDASKLLVLPA